MRRKNRRCPAVENIEQLVETTIGYDVGIEIDDAIISLGKQPAKQCRLDRRVQLHDIVSEAVGLTIRQIELVEEDAFVEFWEIAGGQVIAPGIGDGDYACDVRMVRGQR
ncbi:hypothetical protein RFM68_24830 [Mesorhizobium sp. MSK_1335]|uniref:Uncharacterized protein n=1 Tax=Mesorhizobium montanum TaxID=3072323 RepID=A0ABU4ZQQ6_9HYPH|nr:hypothetical protein [Mesorhizobium sp. MSK_1335]MDX8527730.1 hypothetical protein [Mesorhizobium sp. MSK_1335]